MKIFVNKGCCRVVFEEGEKYSGKTLLIDGEGNLEGEFCIYKSSVHKMCWANSQDLGPNSFVYVDAEQRDAVLAYVMEEAKYYGLSMVLW